MNEKGLKAFHTLLLGVRQRTNIIFLVEIYINYDFKQRKQNKNKMEKGSEKYKT